jgi:hypothetical protein
MVVHTRTVRSVVAKTVCNDTTVALKLQTEPVNL